MGKSAEVPLPGVSRGSNCPYCGVLMDPRPKAKKKCQACGKPVHVRTLPGTDEKVLSSEPAGQDTIEKLWGQYHKDNRAFQALAEWGIHEEQARAMLRRAGPSTTIHTLVAQIYPKMRDELAKKDLHRAKMAAWGMARYQYEAGLPFFAALQEAARLELVGFQRQGRVEQVQVLASNGCPRCKEMDRKRFTILEALRLMRIPNGKCSTIQADRNEGWCRCLYVAVTQFSE